jgi:hypothetical protein
MNRDTEPTDMLKVDICLNTDQQQEEADSSRNREHHDSCRVTVICLPSSLPVGQETLVQ